MVITYSKSSSIDRPGKVANPARDQLNRENEYFLVRVRAWEFGLARCVGSAVPPRVSLLLSIHTPAKSGAYLYGIPLEFRDGIHLFMLNRHTPAWSQSRVYRVTQLRTDGVHCRESAGTEPVNLKVVPNKCCLGRSPWTN